MQSGSRCVAHAITALLVLAAACAQAQVPYRLTDLGPGTANAINEVGQVVGRAGEAGVGRAFIWTPGKGVFLIPVGEEGGALAFKINDFGQVLGQDSKGDFLYQGTVGPTLRNLAGPGSRLFDINNAGTVVGATSLSAPVTGGFRWTNGVARIVSPIALVAINNAGQAAGLVGDQFLPGMEVGAVFVHTDESGLSQVAPDSLLAQSIADINDRGQIAGKTHLIGDQAFITLSQTKWMSLDSSVVAPLKSDATGMNDAGHVVGSMTGVVNPDRLFAPFLYLGDPTGEVLDFQTLLDPASTRGWVCCSLSDINNAGQIVGSALGPDNVRHAVLLTPIPEPETYALMLAGLGALGLISRRRNRRGAS